MKSSKTRMLPARDVFKDSGCSRTQRSRIKDCFYFATRVNEWLVFVKDKGPEFEPKSEEQLNLF